MTSCQSHMRRAWLLCMAIECLGTRPSAVLTPCVTGCIGGLPGGGQTLGNMAHRPVCRHFLRDRCKYGVFCRFRHELTPVRSPDHASPPSLLTPLWTRVPVPDIGSTLVLTRASCGLIERLDPAADAHRNPNIRAFTSLTCLPRRSAWRRRGPAVWIRRSLVQRQRAHLRAQWTP
jgi:hypothetical protein